MLCAWKYLDLMFFFFFSYKDIWEGRARQHALLLNSGFFNLRACESRAPFILSHCPLPNNTNNNIDNNDNNKLVSFRSREYRSAVKFNRIQMDTEEKMRTIRTTEDRERREKKNTKLWRNITLVFQSVYEPTEHIVYVCVSLPFHSFWYCSIRVL